MANPVNPRFIQAQSFQLSAAGATAGSTSITLQSFLYSDGVTQIVTADLGDWCYMTLEPNNGTQEEAIQFTGVTQNANGTATLTGVSSVGFKYPYTVTSGLALNHAGGVTCIISNDAAMYGNLVAYMNSTLASGLSPFSDINTAGLVQEATVAQINSGTATGSTGAHLFISPDMYAGSNLALASGTIAALVGSSSTLASGAPSGTNKFLTQLTFNNAIKYGGTGADGAGTFDGTTVVAGVTPSGGVYTFNLSNAALFVKNFTSIAITGTASVVFINPNTNGTTFILKSQGNVTLTSTTAPMLSVAGMGGQGGAGYSFSSNGSMNGNAGSNGIGFGIIPTTNAGGAGQGSGSTTTGGAGGAIAATAYPSALYEYFIKYLFSFVGSGGGSGGIRITTSGGATLGAGGNGGGGLIIECGGSFNFTTSGGISVAGTNGAATSATSGNTLTGGAGGGAGGFCYITYNSLTANTGTVTVTAGTGSAFGSTGSNGGSASCGGGGGNNASGSTGGNETGNGGTGATGISLITANTEFV
jgi:hypothetical protein